MLTGIGLAVVANSLAVIKKLVFEDKVATLAELDAAMNADWEGYDALRTKALAVVKYGNDDDYVDGIARDLANYYYRKTRSYKDNFGSPFNSAFMGHFQLYPDLVASLAPLRAGARRQSRSPKAFHPLLAVM